jgi:cytochrome c
MPVRIAALLVPVVLLPATLAAASTDATPAPRILVFTKTAGFRHDSIPAGVRAVRELAAARGIRVESTANGAAFNTRSLKRYRAVVFLSTTGDVLTAPQQRAFERYVRGGGGFVGVHAAADTEYGWAWYSRLVGARFRSHPAVQPAAVEVRTRSHPSTAGLPRRWTRTDEWYNFASRPPRGTLVLATLDETSYMPGEGAMGPGHPIAWAHSRLGGRAWYTGGGHTAESFAEPLFRRHLIGGIRWAARLTPPRG